MALGVVLSERHTLLLQWLERILGESAPALSAASSDASFRRYWRLRHGDQRLIAMDAPPATENNAAFVRMARALRDIGLNVPEIVAEDREQGFLLVGDLGAKLYLDHLRPDSVDRLYGDAICALITLQAAGPRTELARYDAEFLARELCIFDEWLLAGLLRIPVDAEVRAMLDSAYGVLLESALEQPTVCVHRDFHSRNLMLTERANPGILDFQDAVLGPVSYDLVSLLKDCYVDWPRARVIDWAMGYFNVATQSGVLRVDHEARFLRWFDLMGAQRHLKAAGIFCRLWLRDGRGDYLQYLPRTLGYLVELRPVYPELSELIAFLQTRVMPRLEGLQADTTGSALDAS